MIIRSSCGIQQLQYKVKLHDGRLGSRGYERWMMNVANNVIKWAVTINLYLFDRYNRYMVHDTRRNKVHARGLARSVLFSTPVRPVDFISR